jgi:hypothetical protein
LDSTQNVLHVDGLQISGIEHPAIDHEELDACLPFTAKSCWFQNKSNEGPAQVKHSSVTELPATGVLAKHRHHEDLKLILEGGHRFYKPPGAY